MRWIVSNINPASLLTFKGETLNNAMEAYQLASSTPSFRLYVTFLERMFVIGGQRKAIKLEFAIVPRFSAAGFLLCVTTHASTKRLLFPRSTSPQEYS
jgi:hypothetical protein